jgi:hypothetical protein
MGARPFTPRTTPAPPLAISRESQPPVSFRRGREASALLLFAIGTFLCLALASFRVDPNDPTVNGTDWVGPVGGVLASLLVRSFGLVAWFVPLELGMVGVPLLRGRGIGSVGYRIAGDLVVAIVLSSLVHVAFPEVLRSGAAGRQQRRLRVRRTMRSLFSRSDRFWSDHHRRLILISRWFLVHRVVSRWSLSRAGLGSVWQASAWVRGRARRIRIGRAQPRRTATDHTPGRQAIIAELKVPGSCPARPDSPLS